MGLRFALILALSILALPIAAGAADAPPGVFALRDGVLIDVEGGVAYVMSPDGLEAVSLSSGGRIWLTQGVAKPLALAGGRLIAQRHGAGARLELAVVDQRSGAVVREASIALPEGVIASVVDGPGTSFRATGRVEGGAVTVSWSFARATRRDAPTPPADSTRAGAARLDPETGTVLSLATAPPAVAPAALPGALARLFQSGALSERPSLVGVVFALAERAPAAGQERLVLRRWRETGEPLPDLTLHEGALAVPYPSVDGRHVIAGLRADVPGEQAWVLYALDTGARLSELRGRGAPGAFAVIGGAFLHVARPFGHRVDGAWVEVPLRLRALSVGSGGLLWERTLLDTEYRGPMPSRLPQPSGGQARPVARPPRVTRPELLPEPGVAARLPTRLTLGSAMVAPARAQSRPLLLEVVETGSQSDTQAAPEPPGPPPAIAGGAWTSQGPGPIRNGQVEGATVTNGEVVGAAHALVAKPGDASIMYVAGVNGGVWKTTNATAASPTWTPLTDALESTSIGALALDSSDPSGNTLVAGIGRFSSFQRIGGPRRGLLRTSDGGSNWTALTSLAGKNISGVVAAGSTIVVSVNTADSVTCPNVGIFRSTDTGATFTQVSDGGMAGGFADDLVSFGAILYTSSRGGGACGSTNGIYKSTTTGQFWSKVSSAAVDALIITGTTTNVELAVNGSGHVFVGIINSGRLAGLFRSTDGGTSWTQLDTPETNEGGTTYGVHPRGRHDAEEPGGQGAVHFSIVADPTNANVVYVGGDRQPGNGDTGAGFPNSLGAMNYTGRLFRVDAGAPLGSQVTALTHNKTASNSAPHADSRDMAFDANNNLIQVDDGGIYRRTSPTVNTGDWQSLNGNLQVNECHDVAYDTVSNIIVCGNQDVGSAQQSAAGSVVWDTINQGDGGDVAVDAISTPGESWRYSSAQNLQGFRRERYNAGNVLQLVEGPALTVTGGGSAMQVLFVTPVEVNAVDGARLLLSGSNAFYESLDRGDTIRQLTGPVNDFEINAMAYGGKQGGTNNAEVVYVAGGTAGEKVFLRTGAGTTLTETTAAYPGGTIRDLVIDPNDWMKVYVVSNSAGAPKVYVSDNAGAAWRDVTGNIATLSTDLRTAAFVPGTPNTLLVGGFGGVFQMDTNAEGAWTALGSGLPKVLVFDLRYDASDQLVVAGTLGRGAWKFSTAGSLTPTTTSLSSAPNPSAFGQSVTFTATVTPAAATGSVNFKEGSTTLGSGGLSAGTATFSTSALGAGSHSITAEYTGSGSHAASISSAVSQVVNTQPALSIDDVTVQEGNAGTSNAVFGVSSSAVSGQTITVQYATANGSASAGSDYVTASGSLTFAAGEVSKTIVVQVNGDASVENDETFTITLSNPANATLAKALGTGTVANDEGAASGPRVFVYDRAVAEGSATGASFRIDVSPASAQDVTVNYATAPGTATAGSDYTHVSGSLTFTPGRNAHSVVVTIMTDATAEGPETFYFNITSVAGATILHGQAVGTIGDPPTTADVPMYRAYNPNAFYHFFTTSLGEFLNAVAAGYRDESNPPCCAIPFKVPNVQGVGTAIFRMYNPNNGRHYYTASAGERNFLMGIGWVYEKDEGFIYASQQPSTVEVFKLYNNIAGVHLYTVRPEEKDAILQQFPGIWFQHTSLGFAVP